MNSILDIYVVWFCATWPMEGPNRLHLNYMKLRIAATFIVMVKYERFVCGATSSDFVIPKGFSYRCWGVEIYSRWICSHKLLAVNEGVENYFGGGFVHKKLLAVAKGVEIYANGGFVHVRYPCCFWRCPLSRRRWIWLRTLLLLILKVFIITPTVDRTCRVQLMLFRARSVRVRDWYHRPNHPLVTWCCNVMCSASICTSMWYSMAWYQLSDALFVIYQNWYSKICINCCLELIVPLLWIGTLYVADADKIIYLLICYK